MNDSHPRGSAYNRSVADAGGKSGASHGHKLLGIILFCGLSRFCTVELQGFRKNLLQGQHQFIFCLFLSVDARNLFNPSDPPVAVLFGDCCKCGSHGRESTSKCVADKWAYCCAYRPAWLLPSGGWRSEPKPERHKPAMAKSSPSPRPSPAKRATSHQRRIFGQRTNPAGSHADSAGSASHRRNFRMSINHA